MRGWLPRRTLGKALRLAGGGQDRAPPATRGIEAFGVGGKKFDGHVDEPLVEEADDDTGLAGHRGMHGMPGEKVAEQRVLAIRGSAADLVTRIEVAQDDRDSLRFKIGFDPVP